MVGLGAVVMDRALIGEQAIVAAMSFVKVDMQVPARVLVAGLPAKVVRPLTDADIAWKRAGTALYVELAQRCRAGLVPAAALEAVEPGRARTKWSFDNARAAQSPPRTQR